jgi:hypothetical protein
MFEIFEKIFFNGREKIFFGFWSLKKKFLGFLWNRSQNFFLKEKGFCRSEVDFGVKSEKMSKILVKRFSKVFSKTF